MKTIKNNHFSAIKSLIACLFLMFANHAMAEQQPWQIGIEGGLVSQDYNDVRIPANTGTQFSLAKLAGNQALPFFRLELLYDLSKERQLRFLIAPLSYTKEGSFDTNVSFDGGSFTAATNTKATYTFNSYRATYRGLFHSGQDWNWYVGGTIKIRDAEIALSQTSATESNTNTGFVPLVNLFGEYKLSDKWQMIVDFDGLIGPRGRAFDLALKAQYDMDKNWYLGGGLRILEGGADNERVYNFSQFSYVFGSVAYRF